jgi:hypothetical protein
MLFDLSVCMLSMQDMSEVVYVLVMGRLSILLHCEGRQLRSTTRPNFDIKSADSLQTYVGREWGENIILINIADSVRVQFKQSCSTVDSSSPFAKASKMYTRNMLGYMLTRWKLT